MNCRLQQRRRTLLTHLCLLACLGFCAFGPGRLQAAGDTAELRFTYWGSPFEKQAIEKAVASFNASHPSIHVTGQHTAYAAYAEKIAALVAAGSPPDVAYLDYAQAFPYAANGKIFDLASFYARQPPDESLLESTYYRFDGGKKVIGTGLATGVVLMYYNKDLFDRAGVAYPPAAADQAWTWDKFVDAAKKLTRDRNGNNATNSKFDPDKVDSYGLSFPQSWWGYMSFIYSNDGQIASEDGTRLLLNQPADVQVLQALQDLIYVHHVCPKPTQSQNLPASDILMQTGKVAMGIDGMWKVLDYSKLHQRWGMAALPIFKKPVTIVISTPKVIFAGTKYPEQAFEFYRYISDPKQVELFKEGLWAPLEKRYYTDPALLASWLQGKAGVYPAEARDVVVDYTLNHAAPQPPVYWLKNIQQIMDEAVTPAVDLIWSGKTSAQDALNQAVRKATPLMQGRW
ncbi:MAG TPA: sugar ABC transporter substrate-binding protein [Chthoniobacterales bacterium]